MKFQQSTTTAFLALSVAVVAGCWTPSQYKRSNAVPGELLWNFDGGFELTQDGNVVADGHLDEIAPTVRCDPAALRVAEKADGLNRAASTKAWLGLGALGGGTAAGVGMIAYGANDDSAGMLLGGVGTILGSIVVGSVLAGLGIDDGMHARALGVDAVNMYNDNLVQQPACGAGRAERRARQYPEILIPARVGPGADVATTSP